MKVSLFEIFKIYFIVGLQLFGGGYVIFPLLKKYLVEDKKYLNEDELIDYLSLSQCLPGIIALNISIFTGYKLRKFLGSTVAIFGLLLPSIVIILLIAKYVSTISNIEFIKNIFFGVRISVVVLLSSMIYDIYKKTDKNMFSIFLFLIIVLMALFLKLSPAILVIGTIFLILLKNRRIKND